MSKIYILYYDFKNTSGNHAGMAYLAKYLNANCENIKLIKHISQERRGGKYIGRFYSVLLTLYLFLNIKKDDKVFFMEYISGDFAYQDKIANLLRFFGKHNTLSGMVHLSGSHLLDLYKDEKIIASKILHLNNIYVLGSSLKYFLKKIGYPNEIIHTFHYVDTNYYKPLISSKIKNNLQVLFIGNIKRNFKQLVDIIKKSDSNIDFHLCMGYSNEKFGLDLLPNVNLYGFLTEEKLLNLMQQCDVNLSVLDDTIGSNAITCSMAVGLVQVVSDVGSIRDYCKEENSFLCNTVEDFVLALKSLNGNRSLINFLKTNTLKKANELSIKSFLKDFIEHNR